MRLLAVPLLLLPLPVLLACTGCAESSSGRCLDFIAAPTPADRFRAAAVVVTGTVGSTDRTVDDFARYDVHRVRVDRVLRGRSPGLVVDVIAPADRCETSGRPAEHLDGDPLDDAGSAVLHLGSQTDDGTWRLVTPTAVDPITPGEPLPF